MVASVLGSVVAVAGSAVSDAGQRIDPNGVFGASCKAVGDTVEAFGCKARDSLRGLEADCMQGVGICAKAATFGAMGAGLVAMSAAYRSVGGNGSPEVGEPSLSPDHKDAMHKLESALGVQSCEVGQAVTPQAWDGIDRRGPDRQSEKEYKGMQRSLECEQSLNKLSGKSDA